MKTKLPLSLLLLLVLLCSLAVSSQAQEPLDGRNKILKDDLLDKLAGEWKLTRKARGQTSQSAVHTEWVLNHQFLFIHMKEASIPSQYEAMIYIGYDNMSERYVAHWIDFFGGRVSETLGYGTRDGQAIKFNFEYPDGPFHNTFTWHPETKSWTTLLVQKDTQGKWVVFGEEELHRN